MTIEEGVASIGANAFYGCSALASLTIPDSVTSCGDGMIQGWDLSKDLMPAEALTLYGTRTRLFNYEAITLTVDGVEVSGQKLTGWNGRAESFTVPASIDGTPVIAIGASFLSTANNVSIVTIGSQVLSLDDNTMSAFSGAVVCDIGSVAYTWAVSHGLSTRQLQYTLSFVCLGETIAPKQASKGVALRLPTQANGYRVFSGWFTDAGCTAPAALDTDGLYVMPGADTVLYAGWDKEVESVPYTWTVLNNEVTITGYTGTELRLTLPTTINGWPVAAVADGAFAGLNLKSVDMGNVQIIGKEAFLACSALESVTLHAATSIGEAAFEDCGNLRELQMNSGLLTIEDNAFARCEALGIVTLPDSVTSLGKGVFADCVNLKDLMLGAGITALPADTFAGCVKLKGIYVSDSNTSMTSIDGVLFNKSMTELLLYPCGRTEESFAIPNEVTAIGDSAFADAAALRSVTVPASVRILGSQAFVGTGLTSFTAPGLTEIGEEAFLCCAILVSAEPGGQLLSIGDRAFAGCNALQSITIPVSTKLNPDDLIFTSADLIITGQLNSSAHAYAVANGILFNDPDAIPVTEVTISQESAELWRGDSLLLSAAWLPANADSGAEIRWYSSDSSVAIVDQNGLVSAMGSGSATVTAMSENGVTAVCEVTVKIAVSRLTLEPSTQLLLPVGETAQITATIEPLSATDKSLVWTSRDPAVASVSDSGLITGLVPGMTEISATTHNGITKTLTVNVFAPKGTVNLAIIPGQTVRLPAPENLERDGVRLYTFITEDSGITLTETGVITATEEGSYTVICKAADFAAARYEINASAMQTMTLPAALTEIGESAFEGDSAAERFVLGDKVTTIGCKAFADMPQLKQVVIPASVTEIAADSFAGSNPTIVCNKDSRAYSFAAEKGLACVLRAAG